MLYTGGHNIDSRRIDAAVTQDVRQLSDIFLDAVDIDVKVPKIA